MDTAGQRARLVGSLGDQSVLHPGGRVAKAMLAVPREAFLPPHRRVDAYLDAALPIGEGQTISAPHMVATMAEALRVEPGHRVLEVGGGSGYHAAILGWLASPGGSVVTIERIEPLARAAREALAPLGLPVEVLVGDGSRGVPERAPFDRISVAAAAPTIPAPLVAQLAPDGVMVIPVGGAWMQELLRMTKRAVGNVETQPLGACRFVPLVGEFGFGRL